jgi:septum formation protein
MKLYLATTSKFKSGILNKVCLKHEMISNDYKEECNLENPAEYASFLARKKALNAANKVGEGLVLGLDTIVYINGKIVEKPESKEEAENNLREASNNETKIITGVCLIDVEKDRILTDHQTTKVVMNEISEEDIKFYIDNDKDYMYVSGYVVETIASCFIKKIDGSFYNILGVPTEKIYEMIKKFGYKLNDFE